MNRKALVHAIATQRPDLEPRHVAAVIRTMETVITTTLAEGEPVQLHGFIRLHPVDRAPQTARNPKTGAPVHVPQRRRIRLRAGERLLRSLHA